MHSARRTERPVVPRYRLTKDCGFGLSVSFTAQSRGAARHANRTALSLVPLERPPSQDFPPQRFIQEIRNFSPEMLGFRISRGAIANTGRASAPSYCNLVGLSGASELPIYKMSGGMPQRGSIARALALPLARPKTPRTWRSKRPRLNIFAQHEMLMAAFPRPQPPAKDIPIYNGRGCTLLELSQGKCRWPISNPGADDFYFCGNEPVKGLPYCLGHARIAYRSVGRQRSNRREKR
jgi:hypothetical protein